MSKADRTKQFIIERVAPIFNKKGAYGTSLSDITTATGLTKGAIYGNFKDKDQLALACFEHNLKFFQKGLYKALASTGNAWTKVERFFQFYENSFEQVYNNGGCALMNSSVEADDGYPLLKERVKKTFENWKYELEGIILEGQQSGEFKAEIEASDVANLIIAGIEGSILLAKSTQNARGFHGLLNHLKTIVEKELKQ
ncbi:TetR/AcrR family transcriptional regulator [Roseivirga sp. UBA1976]|uniref:TetR/AcrR family transcriptional regulator n=1 Tax=Roseivirga sp. UBA1976 TaxID=1947386 RepID=UPI00257C5ADE|nr:TetR/AcrR family transcriptional regulator [Roseivirga sp. UBA1976]|tara:strand:+ start:1715 stop:2308 length:594 start_codon:yes stop_codon:yes gene_type:complete